MLKKHWLCPFPTPCLATAALPRPARSLRENEQLEELHLLGNPCTRWPGYRPFVVATLPQLQRLDGEQVGGAGPWSSDPLIPACVPVQGALSSAAAAPMWHRA